jgi:hypothetical protein
MSIERVQVLVTWLVAHYSRTVLRSLNLSPRHTQVGSGSGSGWT